MPSRSQEFRLVATSSDKFRLVQTSCDQSGVCLQTGPRTIRASSSHVYCHYDLLISMKQNSTTQSTGRDFKPTQTIRKRVGGATSLWDKNQEFHSAWRAPIARTLVQDEWNPPGSGGVWGISISWEASISSACLLTQARPHNCLLYTSPSPRDRGWSRMPSSA